MNRILLLAGFVQCVSAVLQMPKWFGDNMVLEANHESGDLARLNGRADSGEQISITTLGKVYLVTADQNGDWTVTLEPKGLNQVASTITVSDTSGTQLTANNVLYGDIFFCSGGSNLVYPLQQAFNSSAEAEVLIKYETYANYRFFMTPFSSASTPQFDLADGNCSSNKCLEWIDAKTAYSTNFIKEFSAVCYLTARDISRIHNMNVNYPQKPVGLIQSGWQDTPIEAWIPKEGLAMCNHTMSVGGVYAPSSLYNSMIHPFRFLTIRAVLWYQGETALNDDITMKGYSCLQEALIKTWRDSKQMGDFAFMIMQLAPTVSQQRMTGGQEMFDIRVAQQESNPHSEGPIDISGVVPVLDLGGYGSEGYVTPPNKNEMARRMALQTVHVAYGIQGVMNNSNGDPIQQPWSSYWSGPVVKSVIKDIDAIIITYDQSSSLGLHLKESVSYNLNGSISRCSQCCKVSPPFEIEIDNNWNTVSYSNVVIENNKITIPYSINTNPTRIRYAWGNYVGCTVASKDELPASPFVFKFLNSISKLKMKTIIKNDEGPPMGWNSWNFAHCNVDEEMAISMINTMATNGMRDAGYNYINIDDCWAGSRSSNGTIIPDPTRFPTGIRYLADYAHSHGMKLGLYTARAAFTCMYRPGSFGYESIDAQTYCDWGVDYLKIDICYGQSPKQANDSWIKFRNGFDSCYEKTGHKIFENVDSCSDPNGCGQWIAKIANSWATGGSDIQANWKQILNKAMHNNKFYKIAVPNHYNDADMLEIGNSGISRDEELSHMGLWSLMSSPLLAGTDIRNLTAETLQIFLNKDVLFIDQDTGYDRVQGNLITNTSSSQIWSKRLKSGDYAVLLLNTLDTNLTDVTVTWSSLGINPNMVLDVKDIWEERTLPKTSSSYTAGNLRPHACKYIFLSSSKW